MTVLIEAKKARTTKKKLLTYEDYVKLTPPDNGNYELHQGKIVFMASPLAPHQVVSMNLSITLGSFILHNKLGRLLAAPMDVRFAPHDVVQPDLLFVSQERLSIIQKIVEGAPDLVIEIKSPSNTSTELQYKKYLYEMGGVQEYWLVNIETKTIRQYELIEEELLLQRVLKMDDTVKSLVLPNFELPMTQVFE
jgi:Uma2 family endonuclease